MRWFIKGDGSFRLWWDLLMMVFTTFNVITIPLNLAFKPPTLQTSAVAAVNAIIDLFYLIDILFTFRTTYMDLLNGVDVCDSVKIASRYFKSGQFFLDFFSTVPWDAVFSHGFFEIVGILKIFRYQRLSLMIKNANQSVQVKSTMKLILVIYNFVVLIHIVGCLWFYVVVQNEKWNINLYFSNA